MAFLIDGECAYEGNTSAANRTISGIGNGMNSTSLRADKRTKSVRPRRLTGGQFGGSNMRGGGTRRGEQKQSTMGTVIRNKFDASTAQAYNSAAANTLTAVVRDDYASNNS